MRIALTQFDPSPDSTANSDHLVRTAAIAADQGAALLLAPEGSVVSYLTDSGAAQRAAQPLDGPFVSALVAASEKYDIAIAAGIFVPENGTGRVHNTLVVAQGGALVSAYRKIHLYDAFSFVESDSIAPGDVPAPIVEIDGIKVGLATCYDLRFPELFRALRQSGADVLALASAWVRGPLKEEHWLTLLRARAIENTCYMVAADQIGKAAIGRSAAFDPFGLPLIDLGMASPGFGMVDVLPERIAEVRAALPSAFHARLRIDPVPGRVVG